MTQPTPPYGTGIEHNAGHEFNYAVWGANTQVSLHNVRWNSDYRDIVYFATQQDLDNYLATVQGPITSVTTYCKAYEPVRLNLPFNVVYEYNYLRVSNPSQPVTGDKPKVFYYFIKDIQFLAPNTTQLVLQLDVWQTFSRGVQFGNCYIERGHIGIANENQFDDHGRKYLTVPEGLDVGNEYIINYALEYTLADKSNANVLVASTTVLDENPGTIDSPNLGTAYGSMFEGLPNGMSLYLFNTIQDFRSAMSYLSQYPWISQGIVSVTVLPADIYEQISSTFNSDIGSTACKNVWGGGLTSYSKTVTTDHIRDYFGVPDRYAHLQKFKVYPYAVIECTTYNGAPLIMKPECVATDKLYYRIAYHLAPPNPRIVVYPLKYNGKEYATDTEALADVHDDGTSALNDRSEFLDFTTGIFDFPMFSIVNNGYLSYMASNAHRIAYAYQNADWTQQRAIAGVNLGYNQATSALNMMGEQAGVNMGAIAQNRDLNAFTQQMRGVGNVAFGAAGGIAQVAGGNPAGGAGSILGIGQSALNSALSVNQINEGASIQMSQLAGNTLAAMNNAQYQRDTNQQYGMFAAQGDYANAIAGINARVQDAKLTQPTTSGQMGGEAFNLAAFKWGVFTRFKGLQPAVQAAIGEFWLRYGYAINRFGAVPDNFQVMSKFTYWKLRETYIISSTCPESFKQTIRGIFEKGVTVWTNPNEMGTIDIADNEPLEGVTL